MNDFSESRSEYAETVYASWPRRFYALLLDSVMFAPVLLGLYLLLQGSLDYGWLNPDENWHLLIIGIIWFELLLGLPLVFTLVYWVKKRGTPGKLALRLRVVDAHTGENITAMQAIVRSLGYFASAAPVFAGFFWALVDDRKQTWHDRLAGTVVVYEPSYELPEHFAIVADEPAEKSSDSASGG